MRMAAESNMNFFGGHGCGEVFPPSFYSEHVLSFQSRAVNSSAGTIQGGLNAGGLIFGGDCVNLVGASSTMMQTLGNYGNLLVEQLPGLKHGTGLAMDWSFSEQAILNDRRIKFADEPGMMKYVKIAASLPEKTVRDVALRCRWMAKKENAKRRKVEDNCAAKKIQSRKESSTKTKMCSVLPDNMGTYPSMLLPANDNNRFSYEVAAIDGATQHLLDENVQVLNQISANLSTFKLHDNVDLFSRTSDNIMAIFNSMSQTPGIMSQMLPLPVSVNEDLMNSILPKTRQVTETMKHWIGPKLKLLQSGVLRRRF